MAHHRPGRGCSFAAFVVRSFCLLVTHTTHTHALTPTHPRTGSKKPGTFIPSSPFFRRARHQRRTLSISQHHHPPCCAGLPPALSSSRRTWRNWKVSVREEERMVGMTRREGGGEGLCLCISVLIWCPLRAAARFPLPPNNPPLPPTTPRTSCIPLDKSRMDSQVCPSQRVLDAAVDAMLVLLLPLLSNRATSNPPASPFTHPPLFPSPTFFPPSNTNQTAVQQRQREEQQQQFAAAAARIAAAGGVPAAGVSTPSGMADTTTTTPQRRAGAVEGGAGGGAGGGGGPGAHHTPTVAERIGLRR